jgi:separase
MTSTVSYHVEEACNILRGVIPNSSTDTNPKTKQSPAHAKKSPRDAVPAKKPTRAASVRTTNKARARNPVTPRKGSFSESLASCIS